MPQSSCVHASSVSTLHQGEDPAMVGDRAASTGHLEFSQIPSFCQWTYTREAPTSHFFPLYF